MIRVRLRRARVYVLSSLISFRRFMNEIVFMFHFLKPRCLVRERIFFREDFYHYVVRYFDGYDELWAESLYDGGHAHVFLGRVKFGKWVKPKNYHLLKWNMQGGQFGDRGAPKLYKLYLTTPDTPKKKPKRLKDTLKPKIYDRDYFVKQGSLGGRTRWAKRGKVIHTSSIDR